MTVPKETADGIPVHLQARLHPHLVGKTVSVRLGNTHYTLSVGNIDGRLTPLLNFTRPRAKPRTVNMGDPEKRGLLPGLISAFAACWFEKTITTPNRDPLIFSITDRPCDTSGAHRIRRNAA